MRHLHQRLHKRTHRTNLVILLAFVVLMQFAYPISLHGRWFAALYMLGYAGMIYFGVAAVEGGGVRFTQIIGRVGAVLFVVAFVSSLNSHNGLQAAMLVAVGLFQLTFLISLIAYMFNPALHTTRIDMLLVAISTYILIGGVFAVAFNLIELLQPGSFVDQVTGQTDLVWQSLMYLSYTSLTTLGFGDIVPVDAWARSLVNLESVVGTLFLATVIAQLVGAPEGSDPLTEGLEGPDPLIEGLTEGLDDTTP